MVNQGSDRARRPVNARPGDEAALEALADALGRDEWVTVLTTAGPGRSPRLHVINRAVPAVCCDILAEAGWYCWPRTERIAEIGSTGTAAAIVAGVLGIAGF